MSTKIKHHTTRDIPASTLASLTPFQTGGALEGRDSHGWWSGRGYLRGHALRAFSRDRDNMDYVIYSYGTPIAWHMKNGEWVRVINRFSPTTGKHQSALNFPKDAPLRTVGFNRSGLSDTQRDALYRMLTHYPEWITPRGQERRTYAVLYSRGFITPGFNPGEYRLTEDTKERLT